MPLSTNQPKLLKGSLISIDRFDASKKQIIQFQYNPESITRSIQPPKGGDSHRYDLFRIQDPPIENIKFEIMLDASSNKNYKENSTSQGIYPELCALELLLYPKSQDIMAADIAAASGVLEIIAPEGPYTILVIGLKKIIPVQITSLEINEQYFDSNLNPIRATMSLGFRVLSTNDLFPSHPAYSLFLTYLTNKENASSLAITNK